MPDPKRERQRQNRDAARAAQLEAARQERKRKSLIRGTVGFVLIIALFAFWAWLHSNSGSSKNASSTSSSSTTTASTGPTTTTTVNPALAAIQCNDTKPPDNPNRPTFTAPPPMTIDPSKTYTAVFETSCGTITATLDPKGAPKTVNNFVFLAGKHFYDGLTFHRVVKNFVIQGGDPSGTGNGGPGYTFADELPTDGYKLGSLAMANSGPNTNGSQFFIVTGAGGTSLPNNYSRFGIVTSGLDVAQKMESFGTEPDPPGKPSRPLYMLSVTIKVG